MVRFAAARRRASGRPISSAAKAATFIGRRRARVSSRRAKVPRVRARAARRGCRAATRPGATRMRIARRRRTATASTRLPSVRECIAFMPVARTPTARTTSSVPATAVRRAGKTKRLSRSASAPRRRVARTPSAARAFCASHHSSRYARRSGRRRQILFTASHPATNATALPTAKTPVHRVTTIGTIGTAAVTTRAISFALAQQGAESIDRPDRRVPCLSSRGLRRDSDRKPRARLPASDNLPL